MVQPDTVIAGFRLFWTWRIRRRKTVRTERRPRTDPQIEPRESVVESTPDSWRVARTRLCYRQNQHGEVHGSPAQAAVADLAVRRQLLFRVAGKKSSAYRDSAFCRPLLAGQTAGSAGSASHLRNAAWMFSSLIGLAM
jgi:hypothetical protein